MAFLLSVRSNVRMCDGYSLCAFYRLLCRIRFVWLREIIDLNKVLKLITTKLLQWHGIWRYLYAHLLQIIMGKIHHFTEINVQHFSSALLPLEVCQQSILWLKKVKYFRKKIFSIWKQIPDLKSEINKLKGVKVKITTKWCFYPYECVSSKQRRLHWKWEMQWWIPFDMIK